MRRRVQRWGNSLALRIPQAFAEETSLEPGCEVELSLENGRLIIELVDDAPFSLEGLLSRVTPDNVHGEVDAGPRRGAEAW